MDGDRHEFSPLSLESLGRSVVDELMRQPVHLLPPDARFPGSGIYALYYAGDEYPYEAMSKFNDPSDERFEQPLYVGKAVPKGSRKGGVQFDAGSEAKIFRRLSKHARSIEAGQGISLSDFYCRFLVVAPVWIRLAESLIITEYGPVWNAILDGFGNNDPGAGRYDQEVSKWDVLHPGRSWAPRLQPARSYDAKGLAAEVSAYLASQD